MPSQGEFCHSSKGDFRGGLKIHSFSSSSHGFVVVTTCARQTRTEIGRAHRSNRFAVENCDGLARKGLLGTYLCGR